MANEKYHIYYFVIVALRQLIEDGSSKIILKRPLNVYHIVFRTRAPCTNRNRYDEK